MESTGRAAQILQKSILIESENLQRFRQMLSYCPETGELSWLVSKSRVKAGTKAGSLRNDGYCMVGCGGRYYLSHRVAWAIHHGAPANGLIDHINGIKDDNRICNLRVVTGAENQQSIFTPVANTATRFRGVTKKNSGFQAVIRAKGKNVYLGVYPTAELASLAYLKAKESAHPASSVSRPHFIK